MRVIAAISAAIIEISRRPITAHDVSVLTRSISGGSEYERCTRIDIGTSISPGDGCDGWKVPDNMISGSEPRRCIRIDTGTSMSIGEKGTTMEYKVKTNYGWGWRVVGAPECPSFGSQTEAVRYAELRASGVSHQYAWETVEAEEKDKNHEP